MTEVIAENAEAQSQSDEEAKKERSNKLRQAYGNATSELREAHRDEFDRLYAKHAEALGVNYTPRPSAEQKAEQQLRALLEEHPHLRDRLAAEQNETDDEAFASEQDGDPAVREFTTK